jgi:hypothetical protein
MSTEVVKSAKKTFVILLPFGITDNISEFLQWTGPYTFMDKEPG